MGSWDALVSMPFSEISAAGRRALMGSGVPVDCMFLPYLLIQNSQIGRIQTYSERILLNTPRIQDLRFKVQGKES